MFSRGDIGEAGGPLWGPPWRLARDATAPSRYATASPTPLTSTARSTSPRSGRRVSTWRTGSALRRERSTTVVPGSASAAVPVEEERLGSTPLRVARCDGRVLTRLLLEEEVIQSLPEGATNGVLVFNDRWVHLISDAVLRGHLEETLDCVVTPARIVTRFDYVHNVDGTSGRSPRETPESHQVTWTLSRGDTDPFSPRRGRAEEQPLLIVGDESRLSGQTSPRSQSAWGCPGLMDT